MADNNGTGLISLPFHIKEECSLANIKVEEVDDEIMKAEPELGGSWDHLDVDVKELLENESRYLESSAEQLLNENRALDTTMKTTSTCKIPKMAENDGTDLNLLQFHIKEKCRPEDITVDEVNEEIIKTEPEVVGGTWVHQNVDVEELLGNETRNLESSVEQLLNENSVCQSCKMEYTDYCINCGHLIHILNNEVQIGVSRKAMESIPKSILEIKGSLIDGYGVYAQRNIPKGVKFGPYEGLETLNRENKYLWKIANAKLVETKDEQYCNWMRYIDCATTQSAQNLIALQFMGKLYYRSLREIKIGEELLINYRNSSSDNLGLQSIQYFQPEVEDIKENIFKCSPCHSGFSEEQDLVTHNKVCPYKKKSVIEVNSSSDTKTAEDDSKIREGINNLSTNRQKNNKNGKMHERVGKKVSEGSLIDYGKINNEEETEKLKRRRGNNDCLRKGTRKQKIMVVLRKCEKDVLNAAKGKKHHLMEKLYKCSKCSYATVQKSNLLSHIKCRHTMEKSYKCDDCSYAAVRKGDLLCHIKSRHTMEKSHKCNECSYAAVQRSNLLTHIKHCHSKEKPFKCNECPYAAKRKTVLLFHIKSRHTKEKPYKCNDCSYAAVQKGDLLNHIRSRHTMEKPYKCNECSYAAVQKGSLLSHMKWRHTKEKPYKCTDCSYSAVRKSNLLSHITSYHKIEKPYKCNDSSYAAVQKKHLSAHINPPQTMEIPYSCNKCSYTAVQKEHLLAHVSSHHIKEKPYKCNDCSYASVQRKDLLCDIKSRHIMDKTYKCNDCSYAAIKKSTLISHIKFRHTKEKSYKCNNCSYAAVQKKELLCHIISRHTMEKPYKCNACSYAAVQKRSLVTHIKFHHTMEKPYKCNECPYAAVVKNTLLNHIKSRHTKEKPYKCNDCLYAAVQKKRLISHVKHFHTMEKPYKCN